MSAENPGQELSLLTETMQPRISDPRYDLNAECNAMVAEDFMGGELGGKTGKNLKPEEEYEVAVFCGKCVVRSDCLAGAILEGASFKNKEERVYGVRGGLSEGQRKQLVKMYQDKGFIDDENWEQAVATAETVREEFYAKKDRALRPSKGKRQFKNSEDAMAAVRELLSDAPDATLHAPEVGSIYGILADGIGVSPNRVTQIVRLLEDVGEVERTMTGTRKIAKLKLVS